MKRNARHAHMPLAMWKKGQVQDGAVQSRETEAHIWGCICSLNKAASHGAIALLRKIDDMQEAGCQADNKDKMGLKDSS